MQFIMGLDWFWILLNLQKLSKIFRKHAKNFVDWFWTAIITVNIFILVMLLNLSQARLAYYTL